MNIDLEKVLQFIRKKAEEFELEGFRYNNSNPELAKYCYDQCFSIEEIADELGRGNLK